MATFIHVNDIAARPATASVWLSTDAVDCLEAVNGGQDTELTLRSGRLIRVVGSLDSWMRHFPKRTGAQE